jgi:hypothetical protein
MTGKDREGFDRIKPPERRLLERSDGPRLDDDEADPNGRAALFSAGAGSSGGARDVRGAREGSASRTHATRSSQPPSDGVLSVHCSRCDATSALDAGSALRAALPLFVVLPWRDHPVFALCPSCRHRAWLRVGA